MLYAEIVALSHAQKNRLLNKHIFKQDRSNRPPLDEDHRVLDIVKDWEVGPRCRFIQSLISLLGSRKDTPIAIGQPTLYDIFYYRIGDYADVALYVALNPDATLRCSESDNPFATAKSW